MYFPNLQLNDYYSATKRVHEVIDFLILQSLNEQNQATEWYDRKWGEYEYEQ